MFHVEPFIDSALKAAPNYIAGSRPAPQIIGLWRMFHVKQACAWVVALCSITAWASGEAVHIPRPGLELEARFYRPAGFDSPSGSIRTRPEVRNPSSPNGWGATVGPHPEARAKAIERATAFIERK